MRPVLRVVSLICLVIIGLCIFVQSNKQNVQLESFSQQSIPKIVHYVYLYDEPKDFNIVYAMSILSTKAVINPTRIYFWYSKEPTGKWWNAVKPHLTLEQVETPQYIGSKKILKGAHKADKLRMQKLLEYGGIYMDLDTISVRPIDDMLDNSMVMGMEGDYGLCNAIIMANKDSVFLKKWWENYEEAFQPEGWSEASVIYPKTLSKTESSITIYPEDTFFKPSFNETEKIFAEPTNVIPSGLRILHLWDTYSKKYYTFESFSDMEKSNSLYGAIVRHLFQTTNLRSLL